MCMCLCVYASVLVHMCVLTWRESATRMAHAHEESKILLERSESVWTLGFIVMTAVYVVCTHVYTHHSCASLDSANGKHHHAHGHLMVQ